MWGKKPKQTVFFSNMCDRHADRIRFSVLLFICFQTLKLPLDFFSCETSLNFFKKKVRQFFFLVPQVTAVHADDLVWWNLVYSENPKLFRRKMTNGAFDQFGEHMPFSLKIVIRKFLLLTDSET